MLLESSGTGSLGLSCERSLDTIRNATSGAAFLDLPTARQMLSYPPPPANPNFARALAGVRSSKPPSPASGAGRSGAALLLLLAAVFGAASQAAQTEIWSATLTVGGTSTIAGLGWFVHSGRQGSLIDTTFEHDGEMYELDYFFIIDSGFWVGFVRGKGGDTSDSAEFRNSLDLQVGGKTFDLSTATWTVAQSSAGVRTSFIIANHGLNWSAGDQIAISLSIRSTMGADSVLFGSSSYMATEGGTVAVTVEMSADPEGTVTIPVTATVQGGATEQGSAGADYSGVPGSLIFNAGETSQTFTVTATNDSVDDDGESVLLGFGTPLPAGLTAGSPSEATVNFTDDDARGLALTPTRVEIDELDVSATGMYALALTSEPTANVTVTLSVTGAKALTTLPTVSRTSLTFTPSNWNQSQTVTVTAPADEDAEDEGATITHAVSSSGDYGASENGTVTVAVDDDETTSTGMTLSANPSTMSESAGPTEIEVTAELNAGAFKNLKSGQISLTLGSNTEGSDYMPLSTLKIVTFAAQATRASVTFTITPIDDALWEPELEGLEIGGDLTIHQAMPRLPATGTRVGLEDDDAEPMLMFTSPSTLEMAEAGGSVELVVAITNDVGFEGERTVNLDFTGSTATPGSDYTQSPSAGA